MSMMFPVFVLWWGAISNIFRFLVSFLWFLGRNPPLLEREERTIKISCSTQLSIFLLINVCIVGISTLMNRENSITGISEPEKKTRIPRNAVSRLPALFHKIEVNL